MGGNRIDHPPIAFATADLRAAILRQHARLGPSGRPSRCHPGPGRQQKVIFPSRTAAANAEADLAAIGCLRQGVYACRGHFHLTKARQPQSLPTQSEAS